MFAQFLNIIARSIKLDKSLYKDNKYFGEAGIYFAGLVMILDGVAGAVAANTIIKTAIGMSGLTAIITWFIWAIFIFVIVCIMLMGIILMQSSKTGGMGSGIAGNAGLDAAFGGEGADKLLVKVTTVLATLFMVMAIVLNVMSRPNEINSSVSSNSVIQGEVESFESSVQDTIK